MGVIEVVTLRLAPGVDEGEFLEADTEAQTEFLYLQRGMVRRTTARAEGEEWLVVTLWGTTQDADAAAEAGRKHPTVARWAACLDPKSVVTRRYTTLD